MDDLMFTGQDFEKEEIEIWEGHKLEVKLSEGHCYDLARIANKILREKLNRAPEVHSEWWNTETRVQESGWYRGKGTSRSTHRARLVCIEPIEKLEGE